MASPAKWWKCRYNFLVITWQINIYQFHVCIAKIFSHHPSSLWSTPHSHDQLNAKTVAFMCCHNRHLGKMSSFWEQMLQLWILRVRCSISLLWKCCCLLFTQFDEEAVGLCTWCSTDVFGIRRRYTWLWWIGRDYVQWSTQHTVSCTGKRGMIWDQRRVSGCPRILCRTDYHQVLTPKQSNQIELHWKDNCKNSKSFHWNVCLLYKHMHRCWVTQFAVFDGKSCNKSSALTTRLKDNEMVPWREHTSLQLSIKSIPLHDYYLHT